MAYHRKELPEVRDELPMLSGRRQPGFNDRHDTLAFFLRPICLGLSDMEQLFHWNDYHLRHRWTPGNQDKIGRVTRTPNNITRVRAGNLYIANDTDWGKTWYNGPRTSTTKLTIVGGLEWEWPGLVPLLDGRSWGRARAKKENGLQITPRHKVMDDESWHCLRMSYSFAVWQDWR